MISPHPELPAEVVIVGAGPAGLACALRLAQIIDTHNAAHPAAPISKDGICVLEKGREPGAHLLSGAVMDPGALRRLAPEFASDLAALDAVPVHDDAAWFLSRRRAWRLPITPPPLRNHGNYIISLQKLGAWLAQKVEAAGITIFSGVAGAELLWTESGRIAGVRTDDKGRDRDGQPKAGFEPGSDITAPVTVLAEGVRGSLAEQLRKRLRLEGKIPQTFALGLKEIWELPPGRFPAGRVYHTLGWPLGNALYGGGWIYGLPENRISLGLVTGLESSDPRLDPHARFQIFKTHPWVRQLLQDGEMIRFGAKALPNGGWPALMPLAGEGWLLLGDSAGFLNGQRLKGIHLAIESGCLAAESVFAALRDRSPARLGEYATRARQGAIHRELWPARNFHRAFEHGMTLGLARAGLQWILGGRDPFGFAPARPGYQRMRPLAEMRHPAPALTPDGRLTFDKMADVYHSGTRHEEDQPAHLLISDTQICATRCAREFGNPCRFFCPAQVYEMAEQTDGSRQIHLNPSNCVHCKTCDILDPYQIITWVPPEGGGGPDYQGC